MKNMFLVISLALVTSTTAFAFDCANVVGKYSCPQKNGEQITAEVEVLKKDSKEYVAISFNNETMFVANIDGSQFDFHYGPINFKTHATCNKDASYRVEAWTFPTRFSPESEKLASIDISNNTFTYTTDNGSISCVKQ